MLSPSAEFYKKFLLVALLVMGSFLVWASDSNAVAYSEYRCPCSNGQSVNLWAFDVSGADGANNRGSSLCSSNYGSASKNYSDVQRSSDCVLMQPGGSTGSTGNAGLPESGQSDFPSNQGQETCFKCTCNNGQSTEFTDYSPYSSAGQYCQNWCAALRGMKSQTLCAETCDPPCDTLTEECQQDPEDLRYRCVPKAAGGCPGGCGTGEECKWDDTDRSWSCEPTGTGGTGGQSCQDKCADQEGDAKTACLEDCVAAGGGVPGVYQPGVPGVYQPSGGGKYELPNPLGVTSISELITKIAKFLIALAIPFAVFMVILAGFRFATAQGNEEKLKKAKQNFIWTIAGVAIILASEALIIYIEELLGAKGGGTVNAFINKIRQTLNSVIVILFILVTIYFGWGVIQYVVGSRGDEEKLTQGKRHMIWGIVGMTVMASAWGIVQIISAFLK